METIFFLMQEFLQQIKINFLLYKINSNIIVQKVHIFIQEYVILFIVTCPLDVCNSKANCRWRHLANKRFIFRHYLTVSLR
jgi:hypothetical protein